MKIESMMNDRKFTIHCKYGSHINEYTTFTELRNNLRTKYKSKNNIANLTLVNTDNLRYNVPYNVQKEELKPDDTTMYRIITENQ